MKKYEILIFDLDDTLFDFKKTELESLKQLFIKYNIPITDSNIEKYRTINLDLWSKIETGEKKKDDIVRERFEIFFKLFNIDIDGAIVEADYRHLLDNSHYLLDGASAVLNRLKEGNYRIFAATNGQKNTQLKRMNDSRIIDYFEEIFISESIGFEKPSKNFFDYVMENIEDFEKEKALMIGDRISADILGANTVGLDTCWLNANEIENSPIPTYTIKTIKQIINIVENNK